MLYDIKNRRIRNTTHERPVLGELLYLILGEQVEEGGCVLGDPMSCADTLIDARFYLQRLAERFLETAREQG